MEETTLSLSSVPITCNTGHTSEELTTLTFRCRDIHFRDAVACDPNGETLFTLGANSLWTSWSLRLTLRSAPDDKHILDVSNYNSKIKEWVVKDPQGRRLCLVKDVVSKIGKATVMQAQLSVEDVGGGHVVVVDMPSSDHAGSRTVLRVEEAAIAEMGILENNDLEFLGSWGFERSIWKFGAAESCCFGAGSGSCLLPCGGLARVAAVMTM
jgi:hypothetical protein